MTWEELVADVTARHPLRESKMFGMPCLKRENGKVVAGYWKDGGLTVKLTDEAAREQALALPARSSSTRDGSRRCGSGCSSRRRSPASGSASSSRRSAEWTMPIVRCARRGRARGTSVVKAAAQSSR